MPLTGYKTYRRWVRGLGTAPTCPGVVWIGTDFGSGREESFHPPLPVLDLRHALQEFVQLGGWSLAAKEATSRGARLLVATVETASLREAQAIVAQSQPDPPSSSRSQSERDHGDIAEQLRHVRSLLERYKARQDLKAAAADLARVVQEMT